MHTYAIEAIGTGMIKIGRSRFLARRLKHLAQMSPTALRVVLDVPIDIEQALHRKLEAHRDHGEWFRDHMDVRAALADLN